jgi:branched-chain amino acid aminotransferase
MYYNENSIVFFDGNFLKAKDVKTDLYTQSLHYGNSAFEGLRAYDTPDGPRIFKPVSHFDRLAYSASKMDIRLPYTTPEMIGISYELIRRNKLSNAYIRPLAFVGANMILTSTLESHLLIAAWSWERYFGEKPIDAMVSSFQKTSPKSSILDAKISGQYVTAIMATTEAKKYGFGEAILLDEDGFVAQGSSSNIFIEKNGTLYTPPKDKIFPGITRSIIFELSNELEISIIEKKITPDELYGADAAFLTGTAPEVHLLKSIDRKTNFLEPEESIGFELQGMYRKRVLKSKDHHFALI